MVLCLDTPIIINEHWGKENTFDHAVCACDFKSHLIMMVDMCRVTMIVTISSNIKTDTAWLKQAFTLSARKCQITTITVVIMQFIHSLFLFLLGLIALGCEYRISSLNKHLAVRSWKINNCFLILTHFLNESFWFMIEMLSKHDYVGAIYLQIPTFKTRNSFIISISQHYNPIKYWTNMSVQRTRTKQWHAPLTTTLGHPKSMQCNFNSCSFNYKSDYTS